MADVTNFAVWLECVFAFGQGAGPGCNVRGETLEELYNRLASVVASVDLARWPDDRAVAIEAWQSAGHRLATSGRTDSDVRDALRADFGPRPTPYCVEAMKLL